MKLFRIQILNHGYYGDSVQHKVFINNEEELEFRRLMGEQIQKDAIKNYEMDEINIEDVYNISALEYLSVSDLRKLILYKDPKKINEQENEGNKVDILKELYKVKKDDNTIYRWGGINSFHILNELITSKHIDKIYLSRQTVVDIIENSTDVKMDTDTLLRYCQISKTTSNKDIADLWYSINCGFNFNTNNYYVYGFKIPFLIDDRLYKHSIVGLHMDKIVALNNVSNEYLDTLKECNKYI